MEHYENDVFTWVLTRDENVHRGRFPVTWRNFYKIKFQKRGKMEALTVSYWSTTGLGRREKDSIVPKRQRMESCERPFPPHALWLSSPFTREVRPGLFSDDGRLTDKAVLPYVGCTPFKHSGHFYQVSVAWLGNRYRTDSHFWGQSAPKVAIWQFKSGR
jgi:hypothetical protein